jgi:hypothetical protein
LNDGKVLTTTAVDNVSTSNLFLHSLFENLEIYFQGKLVSSKNHYHYCSYLLSHLSYSKDYKTDLLQSALYHEDNNAAVTANSNPGYVARQHFIRPGGNTELCGILFDDLHLQDRWILPNIDIRIRLKRSPPAFCLLSPVADGKFTVRIEEAVYYAKRQMVTPKILELHEKSLDRCNALYPFTSNQIKTVSIPKASNSAVFENIFPSNKLPQVVLIGFTTTDGFNGNITKNPYNFQDFGLTNINLSVDNISLEYRNLNLDFSKTYLLAYQCLITGLNLENKSVGINRSNYKNGNVIYGWQILGFEGESSFAERVGSIKLEVTFKEPLTEQITGVILSQSQNLLSISKHREIENPSIF